MKKIIFTLIFTLTSIAICNAQKIEIKKVFGGYLYSQNGEKITMKKLENVMETNTEALKLIKKAKSGLVFSTILAGAGGALIGFPIGTAIRGEEDPNWTLALIGGGLIGVTIPISSAVNKNTKKAVNLYNSSLNATSYNAFNPEFNIVANGNGIGLSINF